MSGLSKIEWTEMTWNPVTGCSKVSAGCKNCYAERDFHRWSKGRPFTDVQCHEDRLDAPLHWRKPRMIFVNSVSDLFHEAVPDEFILRVFMRMDEWRKHTFQILTKRPERALALLSRIKLCSPRLGWSTLDGKDPVGYGGSAKALFDLRNWPLPNVWLGVSIENQEAADERIPLLLKTPAAVRFVSCEPLLGPVNLNELPSASGIGRLLDSLSNAGCDPGALIPSKLDWVIVGGESGPHARPMHLDWARSLRDQCQAAKVPFFFKQWGEWLGAMQDGATTTAGLCRGLQQINATDEPIRVGKHAAGRLLDGGLWNEYPDRRLIWGSTYLGNRARAARKGGAR
jgi:protein gp37